MTNMYKDIVKTFQHKQKLLAEAEKNQAYFQKRVDEKQKQPHTPFSKEKLLLAKNELEEAKKERELCEMDLLTSKAHMVGSNDSSLPDLPHFTKAKEHCQETYYNLRQIWIKSPKEAVIIKCYVTHGAEVTKGDILLAYQ